MFVRVENTLATVLNEVLEQQVEEAMQALSEGPERLYG
jgi:hypothetical protein